MVLLPSPLKAQKAMAAVPGHRGGVPGREVDLAPVGTQGLDETVAAPFERWRPVGLVHHLELKGDCVLGLCHRIPQQSSESGEGTVGDAHGQRADAIDLAWRGSEHGRTVECPALARQPWGVVLRSELPSVSMALADQRGAAEVPQGQGKGHAGVVQEAGEEIGFGGRSGSAHIAGGLVLCQGGLPPPAILSGDSAPAGGFRVWVPGFGEWLVVRGGGAGRLAPYAKVS